MRSIYTSADEAYMYNIGLSHILSALTDRLHSVYGACYQQCKKLFQTGLFYLDHFERLHVLYSAVIAIVDGWAAARSVVRTF